MDLEKSIHLLVIFSNEQPLSETSRAIQVLLGYLEFIESELFECEEVLASMNQGFVPPILPDVN